MSRTERDPAYLKRLLILLVSASFFEGYDSSILALLLADIQSTFRVSEATLGVARIPIELGLFVAFFITRLADRKGRRPLLLWSVVGYTAFTALTAISWDIWSFAFFQFGARVFLGTEYAIAVTMVVEEFPASRRGRALGTLLTWSALGTIAVALLLGVSLQDGPLEWRTFYLIGLFPLIVLAVFRRGIKETQRFEESQAALSTKGQDRPKESMLAAWAPKYRKTLVVVGLIHLFRSIPLFGSTAWWAFYAERERGYSSIQVALYIVSAYGLGCIGYYVCGRSMERWGRKPTAIVYSIGGSLFAIILFQSTNEVVGFFGLGLAVFFGLGISPVMSAFATELFPTEIRGQAAAWVRNWFEIAGFVFGPALVGILGDHSTGAIGNIGDTVSLMMFLWLPGAWLVWRYLPETKGMELEDIGTGHVGGVGVVA